MAAKITLDGLGSVDKVRLLENNERPILKSPA